MTPMAPGPGPVICPPASPIMVKDGNKPVAIYLRNRLDG